MNNNNIKIAAIQETKLAASKHVNSPGFTMVRKDRTANSGGGVAFLIDHSIQYEEVKIPNPDAHMEVLRIRVETSDKSYLNLTNIYIPPTSSCSAGYSPALVESFGHGRCAGPRRL